MNLDSLILGEYSNICKKISKSFYNKYLYKIEFRYLKWPGTDFIRNELSIDEYFKKTFNSKENLLKNQLDIIQLLQKLKNEFKIRSKWVFGYDNLHVYFKNKNDFGQFLSHFSADALEKIYFNIKYAADNDIELLKSGAILKKSIPNFNYKITVKSGYYTIETRQAIDKFFKSHADNFKLTSRLTHYLTSAQPRRYSYNHYFYAKSIDDLLLINLIEPNFVGTTHYIISHTKSE